MSRLTSYASLSSAETNDVMPIVDVNDTTMAPTGTTKKITVGALLNAVNNNDWFNAVTAGADPTGDVYSDTAFANMVDNYQETGQPGYIPAGSYKIQDPLNWKVAGLVVYTDGAANSKITQAASNTPILQLAGQGQRVGGLTLTYTAQQTTAQTAANGIEFGDATVGSCWMGIYEDLFVELAYTGLAIPSALSSSSVAGMFSCAFRNIHVLGYAHHGLGLAANGGGSNAGCTGCTWDNIYIHNNYSGSPANCNSYPVYLAVWDEVEFNQLNIEHGESFNFDLTSFSQVRNCTIRGLHIESMQLSASSVNGGFINADNGSTVIVDGMTVKYSTLSGSTDNPVARFSTAGPSSVIIRGFSEQSTNTITTPSHPYADFGGIANCEFAVDGITATQVTSYAINKAAGCVINIGTQGSLTIQASGDTSGVTDTAYRSAAIAQLGSRGGTVFLAPGAFYWTCGSGAIAQAGITLQGAGLDATIVYAVGTGDCIRMYSTQQYTSGFGGGVKGLTVDGTNAGAGSCGVHAGDIYQLQWDVGVRFFQGSGSKGIWFDNQYFWCEDMYGHVWAQQNTANVVFDNSANVGGSAATSFARTLLDIVLDCKGVGDGVILQGGAELYDSRIGIYGNMDYGTSQFHALTLTGGPSYSFTATHASPCVFTASGSYFSNGTYVTLSGGSLPGGFSAQGYYVVNASGATFELAASGGGSAINSTSTGSGTVQGPFSRIYASRLDIGVECNATVNAYQPVTISFGTQGSNAIRDCTGIIDFTGSNAFATTVNSVGSFDFDGICMGDVNLFRVIGAGREAFSNGAISNGAFITTRYNDMGTAAPATNITGAILGTNDPGAQGTDAGNWANRTFTLVNYGPGSITFAATSTSHVATGTACSIPAGTSMVFEWISDNGVWYPAQGSLGSVTAGDTSIVVGGTATAPTIETGTLDVIAADHPAAANWSNNSYKITSLANGVGAQDAAAFGQIPVADSTAAHILPDGIQAAGSNGKWADSGHVHPNYADLSLYLAPTGATGETFPRTLGTTYFGTGGTITSEQVYVSAIPLPKGLAVNNITLQLGSATFTLVDVTHGWYALLDSSLVCRAVSADQTSGNWGSGSASSAVTLSVSGSAYTTTYGGLYYIAFCATFTGTSGEFVAAGATIGGISNTAPILCGTSSASQTTPPTAGSTTLGAVTVGTADRFYAYTS